MRFWRLKQIATVALALALLVGSAAYMYGRWSRPLLDAEAALAAGDHGAALAAYGDAEARFRRFPLAQQLLARDYARVVHNQLALLHALGDYDAVIARAESAPTGAIPRFWTGSALFALAVREEKPESRLVLLSRAEAEFKEALEASPDDWDTKFNYEVAARLAEELRKQPANEPDSLMQLLRPQQHQPRPVRKRG